MAVYRPANELPCPALLAASPYRFDNNRLPAGPPFMFRETGPIEFYVQQGYAYVHLDVRGCGRSEGDFQFLGSDEQTDLYDVIEWIAAQAWCTGKVGGIGESYYCMSQWWMGVMNPPSLCCLGCFDGLNDPYRTSVYQGGILGNFFPAVWWNANRNLNEHPATGPSREQPVDLNQLMRSHPMYDAWWKERCAWEKLSEVKVPVYSHGIWSKMHRRGNIDAFDRVSGQIKLHLHAIPNAWAALGLYASVAFHQQWMLPFYDLYLKDLPSAYVDRPRVYCEVQASEAVYTGKSWPLPDTSVARWFLSAAKSGAVVSINDGSLTQGEKESAEQTEYSYPRDGWMTGVVGFGEAGPRSGMDPIRRILTFTTPELTEMLVLGGPAQLTLYLASTNTDTDVFVTLSDQPRESPGDQEAGRNFKGTVISQGWLRASHRELDDRLSLPLRPYLKHSKQMPLIPNTCYSLSIPIEHIAYCIAIGHRLRLELANSDSAVTAPAGMDHEYLPIQIGADTIFHSPGRRSVLELTVIDQTNLGHKIEAPEETL